MISKMTDRYEQLDSYTRGVVLEREAVYSVILKESKIDLSECRFLEIGAGHGFNVHFFLDSGVQESNCTLIEPDPDRNRSLKKTFPNSVVELAHFDTSEVDEKFDIILVSLVLSSVLDVEARKRLLEGALRMLSSQGHLIVYEFKYDNPSNKKVKGVPAKFIQDLLPEYSRHKRWNVSLAPPLGRILGGAYSLFNSVLPFLRTHYIMDITTDNS